MRLHARHVRRLAPICCMFLLISYTISCAPASEATREPATPTPTAAIPAATSLPSVVTPTATPMPGAIDLSQTQPAVVHTVPTPSSDGPPPNLTDVYFVSASTGFGVTATGGIYRSTDGGVTWQIRFRRSDARFYQVVFGDATTGMALGGSECIPGPNCNGPTILARTNDSGDNWEIIQPEAPEPQIVQALPVLNIAFVSAMVSYAVPDPDQNAPWVVCGIVYSRLTMAARTGMSGPYRTGCTRVVASLFSVSRRDTSPPYAQTHFGIQSS
jgi:hypothetical protein